jgi:hypothetical protein
MYRTTLITFLITRLQKNTEHNYDIDCDYVTLDVVRPANSKFPNIVFASQLWAVSD